MAYPIRFKLIDRKTGEALGGNRCPLLLPNGQPAVKIEDYYTYVNKVSCADYRLLVALEKDTEGNWVFKAVGY